MAKDEPSLIPEWLKNSGSSGSSSARSDDRGPSRLTRNHSFARNTTATNNNSHNNNGHDFGRSFSSDRTTSSYFHRSSSSNGSGKLRFQSSSGARNHHDRECSNSRYESNNKEKSFLRERWRQDSSDSLKSASLTKFDRDGLRRSQSMISGKRGDKWHRKVPNESDDNDGKRKNGSPTKSSPIGGPKMNFTRDFPSLGSEERAVTLDVRRVASPDFGSAINSLPIGISSNIGGEKWKSALAEVPGLVGSNGTSTSLQQLAIGTNTGLNMAEAVSQGSILAQAAPQLSVGTQRSDELSKKLIPVTPSLPKSLIKGGQQQHLGPSLVSHSPRAGPVKGEVSKPKLHILKPVREKNGVAAISMDKLSPTGSSKTVTPPSSSSVSGSASFKSPPSNGIADPKPVMTVLEKRPTSQARSRNDFFNSVRKKSMANNTHTSSSNALSASDANSVAVEKTESVPVDSIIDASLNVDPCLVETNGDANEHLSNGNEQSISGCLSVPDEEEAAFLRSLGWEEDSDEGGLTEEEISAFFRDSAKYVDLKPNLKALQPEIPSDPPQVLNSSSNGKLES